MDVDKFNLVYSQYGVRNTLEDSNYHQYVKHRNNKLGQTTWYCKKGYRKQNSSRKGTVRIFEAKIKEKISCRKSCVVDIYKVIVKNIVHEGVFNQSPGLSVSETVTKIAEEVRGKPK